MPSIHRSVYRAQAKAGQADVAVTELSMQTANLALGTNPGDLLTISLFRWGHHLFTYCESIDQPCPPEHIFSNVESCLEEWPGTAQPRHFVPMMDIFHYLAPENLHGDPMENWRRKAPVAQVWGRLARLQPAMVSSYIFYHYQMQEEKPGVGDQYGIISLHEDLIFFYQERPAVVRPAEISGKLETTNTPDHWHDVMFPHFHLWDDAPAGQEIWREVETVCHRTL